MVSVAKGGQIDLSHSYYLVLLWNTVGAYQLFQYKLDVVTSAKIVSWDFPRRVLKGKEMEGRRLKGNDAGGALVEWYGESGGQLKYYPLATDAVWASEPFHLEPLPTDTAHSILAKVAAYYPGKWKDANQDQP